MNDDQQLILNEIRQLSVTVDERLAKIDDRFAKMDDRFAKIDDRFAKMDDRFAKMDDRFTTIDDRFDEMKLHLDVTAESLRSDIRQVAEGVLTVDEKLGRFHGEMDGFRTEVNRRFDDMQVIVSSRSRQNGHHTD